MDIIFLLFCIMADKINYRGYFNEKRIFTACVRYSVFRGTAAADRLNVSGFVDKLDLDISQGEYIVGIKVDYSGEFLSLDRVNIDVKILLASIGSFDNTQAIIESIPPLHVRRILAEMSPNEFFRLFKHFNISLSVHGVIDGKENLIKDDHNKD